VSVLKRDFAAVLVWALFLTGLTAVQLLFMAEPYSYGLLGGAALATFLFSLYLLARRRPAGEGERLIPDLSYPTVAFAVGIAAAALGVPFGVWLVFPGLGLLVLGAGGLLLERRRAP
jgi:uncharacterized membrane protein